MPFRKPGPQIISLLRERLSLSRRTEKGKRKRQPRFGKAQPSRTAGRHSRKLLIARRTNRLFLCVFCALRTPSRFSRVRLLTAAPRRGSSRCSAPRARLSSRRRSSPTPLTRSTRWPPDRKSSHLIFSSPSQSPLTSRPGYGGSWSSAVAPGGPFSLSADRTLARASTLPSAPCCVSTSRR